jgi:aspartyl protease family protein
VSRQSIFWIAIAILLAGLAGLLLSGGSPIRSVSDDDFARLVGLSALVLVIGAGAVRFRALGQTVRALGAWVLICLALVAGYQYRYELQDFAHRVTAGLVPGSPLTVTDAAGRHSVILDRSSNGHFEVRGDVDDATVAFVVDTGATVTVLTSDDARRAGHDVDTLVHSVPISTANGQSFAAPLRVGRIAVGGIERTDRRVLVAADGTLGQSLLGMDFISSLSGFDMRGDRLTLRD